MVKMLLEKGADPNAKHQSGRTALIDAAVGGHANIVEILLNRVTTQVVIPAKAGI